MLTDYVNAAMRHAKFERLEDDTWYGEIPELQGVFANAPTREACREQLRSVLEGWIALGYHLGHILPVVDGIDINIHPAVMT